MKIKKRNFSRSFNDFFMLGLLIGKPLGIALICFIIVRLRVCRLPLDLNWKYFFGAGLPGSAGFIISYFTAGIIGFLWLKLFSKPTATYDDLNAMDLKQLRFEEWRFNDSGSQG